MTERLKDRVVLTCTDIEQLPDPATRALLLAELSRRARRPLWVAQVIAEAESQLAELQAEDDEGRQVEIERTARSRRMERARLRGALTDERGVA